MRHVLIFLIVGALAATLAPAPTHAQGTVRVFVDGDLVRFDQPPIVVGARILVPLRGIFERLGATVEWEAATRTVIAVRGSTVVELVIGQRSARVNDRIVPLDVPAMVIRGRTLVPLRFVSESMGAEVQYQEATRTVLIFSPGAQPGPPPPAPPAAQVVKGTLVQVRTGDNPSILVEQGNVTTRVFITPDTAITRVNLTTNNGGSVSLNALRVGDEIEGRVGNDNRAERIRATFRIVVGRLDTVAGSGRTIVLTNGNAYRTAESVEVIIDDRASTIANLKAGMILALRLNPESNLVYGITAETASAQVPVTRPGRPVISNPDANASINSPVEIEGRAEGATKVLITIDAMLGVRLASVQANVSSSGRYGTNVSYQPLFPGWPYIITIIAVNTAGLESDPTTVTVRQR
jgi:hypothetical protein